MVTTSTAALEPGQPHSLTIEFERLLREAMEAYADPDRAFTLVAIPCCAENGKGKLVMQPCEDESPERGHMREGKFCWPLTSFRVIGNGR
jgi:hypothetical protein